VRGTLVRAASVPRLSVPAGIQRRAAAIGVALAVVMALAPIALYIWVAAHRLGYPYELDWLEGGAVELTARVLHGQPLYTAPTLAYVSYTYPPLYSYVSAAVAAVTGLGFLPLRLVSFTSTLVAFVVLWRWVAAATADRCAGVVAAGLFAATYGLTGWWFDVGRLDSMFVALALAALWLGRHARTVKFGFLVGVIAFLAFFTKQIALVAVLPALVWLALTRPRAGLAALVTLVTGVAASTLLLDHLTSGWYRYFVLGELAGQPWQPRMWIGFWRLDIYHHLRPLVWLAAGTAAVAVLISVRRLRSTGPDHPRATVLALPWSSGELGIGYELASAAGLLMAAWFSRLHTGGYLNVLLPAYAACALLGGVAFARARRLGPLPALAAVVLVILQFGQLLVHPDHAVPRAAERTAGAELIMRLRELPGPVLVLAHPWYGTLAGKGSFAQADAITEVLRSDSSRGVTDLRRALRGALDRYGIRAVVLDKGPPSWLAPQLARHFVLEPGAFVGAQPRPPADLRGTPVRLYVRRATG
jgi:hypothetical protein